MLEGACEVFCAAGFCATSIHNLTDATGPTAGSLYKAYRDKEGMFAHALARYVARREEHIVRTLEGAETARARLARLLGLYAALSQSQEGRRGCMVVAGLLELDRLGDTAGTLRHTLECRRIMLARLVADGQLDGSIRTPDAPEAVADLLLALLQGMRVLGKGDLFPADADGFVRLGLKLFD